MKNITQLLLLLFLFTLLFSSSDIYAQSTVLIYDDFNAASIDWTVWQDIQKWCWPSWNGGYSIENGKLKINSTTQPGAGCTIGSALQFTLGSDTLVFETNISLTDTFSSWGFKSLDWTSGIGFGADANGDLTVGSGNGQTGTSVVIPNIDIFPAHNYRMEVNNTLARFYVDGKLVYTLTDSSLLPLNITLRVFVDKGAMSSTLQFAYVDFIRLSIGEFSDSAMATDGEPLRIFFDNRINDYDTGNPVVLYGVNYGEDSWGLNVYEADGTGLLLSIPPATIDASTRCPASNTLVYADEKTGISLWNLPERSNGVCPFQLNAPTDEAGKWYIIIFDELYPNTYYESHEEYIGINP